jgi:hypothetical protein
MELGLGFAALLAVLWRRPFGPAASEDNATFIAALAAYPLVFMAAVVMLRRSNAIFRLTVPPYTFGLFYMSG